MAHVASPSCSGNCFGCKLNHWRQNGAPGVVFAGGKDNFHNSTIRERVEKNLTEARAAGLDPQPVGTRWV